MRTRAVIVVLTALGVTGCGRGEGASQEDAVREVVTRFGQASAAKDYQAICDDLLAPGLVDNVEQYGLPCELAFKRGIGDVSAPRLAVGAVRVDGARATARVTTSAQGQAPSTDVLELRRAAGSWRITALG